MDKIDRKILISLLFIVVIFLVAGIFLKSIDLKREPISFTPARPGINTNNNLEENKDKDNYEDETLEEDNSLDNQEDLEEVFQEEDNLEGVFFTPSRARVYATVSLNVRRGPGQQYDVVTSLSVGDEATLIAKGDNGWYKLIVDNLEVYADGNYLSEEDPR